MYLPTLASHSLSHKQSRKGSVKVDPHKTTDRPLLKNSLLVGEIVDSGRDRDRDICIWAKGEDMRPRAWGHAQVGFLYRSLGRGGGAPRSGVRTVLRVEGI